MHIFFTRRRSIYYQNLYHTGAPINREPCQETELEWARGKKSVNGLFSEERSRSAKFDCNVQALSEFARIAELYLALYRFEAKA